MLTAVLAICAAEETQVVFFDRRKETSTLTSREVAIGGDFWEVYSRKRSKRELFKVHLGDLEVRWWSTGIVAESDFNHDGRTDYVWSGGDDTSNEIYVILSGPSGYGSIDVYRSLARDWVRRFGGPTPDLALFGTYMPKSSKFYSAAGTLRIEAEFEWAKGIRKVSATAAEFVPVRRSSLRINPSSDNPARHSSSH